MTAKFLFANNAGARLAAPILAGDLTLTVSAGLGALFPVPTGSDYFSLTAADAGTGLLIEVMHCTNVTGDVLTVVRGQEGTTAKAYAFNDPVANLWTAGQATAMAQLSQLGTASTLNASDQLGTVAAVQVYAGNPNTHVAGNAAVVATSAPSMVWDTSNSVYWVCTSTGNAASAVWLLNTPAGATTFCGTSTGSANAQILTPTIAVTAYTAGLSLAFVAGFTNATAMTLNVSGLGVKNVFKDSPTGPIALTGGEVVAGNMISVRYDGTQFQLTATELGTAALANASSSTGIVVAISGATVIGHLAVFSDTAGTVIDGGNPGAAAAPTYINSSQALNAGVYWIDTSGSAITITLPTGPVNGTVLGFIDGAGTFSVNALTIARNGHTIMALAEDMTCNIAGLVFMLEYKTATSDWRLQ